MANSTEGRGYYNEHLLELHHSHLFASRTGQVGIIAKQHQKDNEHTNFTPDVPGRGSCPSWYDKWKGTCNMMDGLEEEQDTYKDRIPDTSII